MGELVRRIRRAWPGLAAVAGLLAVAGPGSAQAAGNCDTSWNGGDGDWFDAASWSHGVPTASTDACITQNGTYTVTISGQAEARANTTARAKSLTIGLGSTGTQTVQVTGVNDGTQNEGTLDVSNGGTIGANGVVSLTASCTGGGCPGGAPATLDITGTLTNQGTIEAEGGTGGARTVNGNLTNIGSLAVNAPTSYGEGTLDNLGTVAIGDPDTLDVPVNPFSQATIINDAGGVISNGGGAGRLLLEAENTYNQGGGATSPASAHPAHPAVVIDGSDVGAALNYTGSGASTILVRGESSLAGDLASAQRLLVQGAATDSPCEEALLTASTGFTNAGSISFEGPCFAGLKIKSGTLSNSGKLVAASSPNPSITRFVTGSLINSGTLQINGPTAFNGSGSSLTQTGGTTAIGQGQILDLSGSSGNFNLRGGVLTGGGKSKAKAAVVNGSVANTGGSVVPGSSSRPGLMTVAGSYSQQARGQLAEIIDGTSVGSGYSQLGVSGGAMLGGTLTITTLAGPKVGHFYTALGGSNVAGRFSKVVGRFPPEGSFPPGWTTGYRPQYVNNAAGLLAVGAAGLRVRRTGTGSGSVTSSPAGIKCANRCDAPFLQTQTVRLTEHAAGGSTFGGWSGACSGKRRTCRVKMNKVRLVRARFLP